VSIWYNPELDEMMLYGAREAEILYEFRNTELIYCWIDSKYDWTNWHYIGEL
jgi:hypothetical protein